MSMQGTEQRSGGAAVSPPSWRRMVGQVEALTGVRDLVSGGARAGGMRRSQARQLAMALARALYSWSYLRIAERFGGMDHTSVIHACTVVRGWLRDGNRWAQDVWVAVLAAHGRDARAYHHWQLGPAGPSIGEVVQVVSEVTGVPLWRLQPGPRRAFNVSVTVARAMVCCLARAGRSGPGWAVAEALGVSSEMQGRAPRVLADSCADPVWRERTALAAARLGVVLP